MPLIESTHTFGAFHSVHPAVAFLERVGAEVPHRIPDADVESALIELVRLPAGRGWGQLCHQKTVGSRSYAQGVSENTDTFHSYAASTFLAVQT